MMLLPWSGGGQEGSATIARSSPQELQVLNLCTEAIAGHQRLTHGTPVMPPRRGAPVLPSPAATMSPPAAPHGAGTV